MQKRNKRKTLEDGLFVEMKTVRQKSFVEQRDLEVQRMKRQLFLNCTPSGVMCFYFCFNDHLSLTQKIISYRSAVIINALPFCPHALTLID